MTNPSQRICTLMLRPVGQLALVFLFTLMLPRGTYAQFYPVQATTQLIPPYSVYLADYATPGSEKLRVILVQRDLTKPAYQLRLVMSVEWNGKVIMTTSRAFNPAPINLDPGIPTIISGADLASYLDSRNIDFVGYNKALYEKTKSLPEGSYRISFKAYDYRRREVQVSNEGSTFNYLSKNEPPMMNLPICGEIVPSRTPQMVVFSWMPRNTSSPNSAQETEYELALYETRPAGRNPNDVVLTTQPVFSVTTDLTQFVYGPAEPQLLEGITYVWRVRAIDKHGRDAFRNNGYSEVCTFRLGADPVFDIGVVRGFNAEAQSERKARIWWDVGEFDGYKVYYKKSGKDYEWFTSTTKAQELKVYDLEPDTEYEARIQAIRNGSFGPYSETVKFRTAVPKVIQCGDTPPLASTQPGTPLAFATQGMIVMARGLEVQLQEVEHLTEDGWYKGTGRVTVNYLGGATFTVKFERIFIDDQRNVTAGRIEFVTRGVASMVEDQLAGQKKRQVEQKQKENREQWQGTDFYEKMFLYGEIEIESVTVDPSTGAIVVTDASGIEYRNIEIRSIMQDYPEKAVIIEDKNGDQYVVQKDPATGQTKVTKVEGGGLSPAGDVVITDADMDLLKKAIRRLRSEYSDTRVAELRSDYLTKKKVVSDFRSEVREQILEGGNSVVDNSLAEGAILLEPTLITVASDEFSTISSAMKKAEFELNLSKVVQALSRETNSKDEYKLIAQSLQIDGRPFGEYLIQRKTDGATEELMVDEVKDALVSTVETILKNRYY
jgi:hypothetical protein